jgi:hypothetical protein
MAIPDSSMHAKKRRYPRYIVDGMGIQAHMLFTDEVELDNLSVAGACIRTRRDLKVGCKYLLKIPDRKTSLYIGCAVTWKREYAASEDRLQEYKAGLQFLNISSDEIIRLKDFMRTTGVPDERRASDQYRVSPLRYYLSSKEIAVLKCPEMLNVKKISLGGMLIGSDCTMDIEGTCLIKILLSGEVEPIKCRGRIASLSPCSETSKQHFDIGVEFLSMEDTDRTRLDGFIRSL